MDLVYFLFMLLLSSRGLAMVAVPSLTHDVTSPTDSVDVVEEFLPGITDTDNIAPPDETTDYDDAVVLDTFVDERSFPPTNGYMPLTTWGVWCNYSQPIIPPMIWRPSLGWCRLMMTCNARGDLIAGNYPGSSLVEQRSWTWCMNFCECVEIDRPAAHYRANFGCQNPAGGYIQGGIGSSSKRDEGAVSDHNITEFLGGLVMEQDHATYNLDNTADNLHNTTDDWPKEIKAADQDPAVKIGYDPSNPSWVNPNYMLTSCTLYPAMDADGLILALAKMMDWCGCENQLNTEGDSYGGVSIYDPDTNVRVWACSVGAKQPCDDTADWYYALGNVTYQCGLHRAGYFYDASRQMAWGFDSYDHINYCQDVRWVTYTPFKEGED